MPLPNDKNDASLDELAGIGRNRRFDEALEDEEFEDIEVVCRKVRPGARGSDRFEEIPLAKPARAFYFGDRYLYEQEAQRFEQGERERILNTGEFSGNAKVFAELKQACQRGYVVPFIGAGMSKSAGCPEWKEYLLRLCREARLGEKRMRKRLEEDGDYEGVMDEIVSKLTLRKFERDFERDFQIPDTITGAVTLLPEIFDRCVVTTNFDRVLERVYESAGRAFVEKATGKGNTSAFFRAIPAGQRYLLKLHGNIDSATERILKKAEYDSAYGATGGIDTSYPVPKILRRLFTSYSFLFIGCSLANDRTIRTLAQIASEDGHDNLPHHYAILACPSDHVRKRAIDQRLADAHISPLWFPDGEFKHIEEILQLLAASA